MDAKSLEMLEFHRVREIIAGYTSFPASTGAGAEPPAHLRLRKNKPVIQTVVRSTADIGRGARFPHRGD
jgi:dsDNA-specific endonuclease/ATPase MutS2